MYCSVITQKNKMCKNYIFQEGLCYTHQSHLSKKVRFNESLNIIQEYKPYIHNQKKLEDGRWYYENGKNPRCFKNIKYDYSSYGKYYIKSKKI